MQRIVAGLVLVLLSADRAAAQCCPSWLGGCGSPSPCIGLNAMPHGGAWVITNVPHGIPGVTGPVIAQTNADPTPGGYNANPCNILVLNGAPAQVYTIQAGVGTPSSQPSYDFDSVGFAFRIQDTGNFYRVVFFPGFPGGALRYEKFVNGVQSCMQVPTVCSNSNVGFTPLQDVTYTLRLDVIGSTFTTTLENPMGPSYVLVGHDTQFTDGGVGLTNDVGPGWFGDIIGNYAGAKVCSRIDLPIGPGQMSDEMVGADITGDGVDDVIAGGSSGSVVVFQHAGGGVFGPPQVTPLPITSSIEGIAAEDLDGDLDPDVVVTSSEGLLVVLENQGATLAVAQTWTGTGPQRSVSAMDTSGDGAPDLVVGMRSGPASSDDWCVTVLVNDGSGSFAQGPQLCFPFTSSILDVTAADVDNDGLADLVFGLSPNVAVALNDGNGGFLPHTVHFASSENQQLILAELNGDTFIDLASVDGAAEGTVSILQNLGKNMGSWLGFGPPVVLPVGGPAFGVAALDVDGDTDLDLACSDNASSEIAIFSNIESGVFATGERLPAPASPYRLFASDVTGDGVADLLGGRRGSIAGPEAVMGYLYPVHTDDRISLLFDSGGLPVRESNGKHHVASASQLSGAGRTALLDRLQVMFDDALGPGVAIIEEGSAGCLHVVVSGGTSPSGTLYGNAGAAGLPVLIYEGQFRANQAYGNETEIALAMAETVAHEIGHKLGLQGHNLDMPPNLLTAGEKVGPEVRKLGLRRFHPVDKTRLSLNHPLTTAEPKSSADLNDLAILNGSFRVPPVQTPDDGYLSVKTNLTATNFLEFGYLNEHGEFVYQGDTNNASVSMGSHFDGGFDLAVRAGGTIHSFSNGGGCFTLSAPNPANPIVFLRADVEFPSAGATLSIDVDAANSTGGLFIPQAGGCGSAGFCTAKTGLACGLPTIMASGTPSASSTSGFTISAGPALSCKAGILLYSNQPLVAGAPFEGGKLCLEAMNLRRGGSTNSRGTPGPGVCDGEFAIDMNVFAQGAWVVPRCDGTPAGIPANKPAPFLSNPGSTISVQFWGRDTPGTGSFVSAGLQYVVGP